MAETQLVFYQSLPVWVVGPCLFGFRRTSKFLVRVYCCVSLLLQFLLLLLLFTVIVVLGKIQQKHSTPSKDKLCDRIYGSEKVLKL